MPDKKYIRPTDVKPGDTVYDEQGTAHTVDLVVGNMISTTDGKVEFIPVDSFDDDEE